VKPPSRQTLSYLRGLFAERGIKPKNKLGQNFLIDLNLLEVLLQAGEPTRDDLVLEVGSGTGGLTVRLGELAGAVVSVEVDPSFSALVREEVQRLPSEGRVLLLHADVLKGKNHLNPEVLKAIEEVARKQGTTRVKLIANLPYAVATPVVSNLLLSELPVERMAVTVQWEIAERLLARPGTGDYGALTVLVQSLADVELVRRLPPTVFWPRPKVDSAIVLIRPSAARRAQVGDPQRLRNFLRDLYTHRRKNLRGALISFPGARFGKEEVDQLLAEVGLDGKTRAEDLDLEQHRRLCDAFGSPA
jgi:16S rRNA (adenine1518-N6/adenine1519-N6)-dimethyltransferase